MLETLQFVGATSAVVAKTSNAPGGTPVNECDVAPTPVLVLKLFMVTEPGGGAASVPVIKDQL